MEPVIVTRGLAREYEGGVRALRGVDAAIAEGEFVAVTGPSGCGKSTLLNLLGGLDRPTGGEIELDGRRVDGFSEAKWAHVRRQEIGFVFQFFNLIGNLSVADNVELPGLLNGLSAKEARERREDAARRPRHRRARPAVPHAALRRPAAAGGDRPRADQPPEGAAGRRADRQPRQRLRPRRDGAAARRPRRAGPDDRARHPRRARGRPRGPGDRDARRRDRPRDAAASRATRRRPCPS